MEVQVIMSHNVKSCRPETDLASAATLMWDTDCGILPVVDDGNKVIGIVTDRDICMAVAAKRIPAGDIHVRDIESPHVHTISMNRDVHDAMELMRVHRIRRLPVVDRAGQLRGLLSLNDIILHTEPGAGKMNGPTYHDTIETIKAISAHRPTASRVVPQAQLPRSEPRNLV